MTDDDSSMRRKFLLAQEAKMIERELTGNDLVHVVGTFKRPRFKINGITVKLAGRKALIFALLVAGGSLHPGSFITTEKLLVLIERLRERGAVEWEYPTGTDVYQAMCALRKVIAAAVKNCIVIESMKRRGYRLNTPSALADDSILGDVPNL